MQKLFMPCTPAGSMLAHLQAGTMEKAWKRLERDTGADRDTLKLSGYTVEELVPAKSTEAPETQTD